MKILFCVGTFTKGGAERVISNLSNFLVKENEIKIVSLLKTEKAYKLDRNVGFEFLDSKDYSEIKQNIFNKILKNIKRVLKLNKIITTFHPDIIVSFIPEPSFLVLSLKKHNKIPVIVSVRNDPKKEYESKIYYMLMKKLYPRADGMVFQTEEAKEYFKDIINVQTEIIPNPINEDFIIEPYNGERKKNIVSVGRLQEQKNHKVLIEAFANLPEKYREYKLIIYGKGNLKEQLEKQIQDLNMQNRIILYGVSDNIKEEIYDSTMFVLSSNYEGMPNSLMEAMVMGLPVISTDCPCGGPRFLINNNENGLLVKVDDVQELTRAMEKILSDKHFSEKIGKEASKIRDTLSPIKINKQWYNYIKKIGVQFTNGRKQE